MHEAFDVQSSAGRLEVVDNVSIAPRCPVQAGDRIEICGEMVHDPGRLPIVHWTHHDPAHHHRDGFIRLARPAVRIGSCDCIRSSSGIVTKR